MVCKCNRLRLLKMCEAGHICMDIGAHDFFHNPEQFVKKCIGHAYLASYIHPHIESHLIVTAPSGMKSLAGISYAVRQYRFIE